MRIAYLTGEYPRVTDTFIQREVAALRQQGEADGTTVHTFSVRSPKHSAALNAEQQAERDLTQYLLPPQPLALLLAHSKLLLGSPKQYLSALALAWQTRQLGLKGTLYQFIYFLEAGLLAHRLQTQNITHLHNHFGDSSCSVAMLASALGRFDYSFTLHGPGIFFEPHRWRLEEKIRRAKFVSCISYFCRSQTMIFAPLEAWPNLHIIHCGVDPAQFAARQQPSANLSQSQGLADLSKPQRLLYVGRLAAAKGLPVLLDSLAALSANHPTLQLTVVGDGPDRAMLEAQAQTLGLAERVDFVGYQSPEGVRDYLQAADVFVMSSFAEGVPVVLMEAMMSGLPVVATQIAGVSELVEEGVNGFLVPPSNVKALSDRIATLLADSDLRHRLGQQGRAKVSQDFNIHTEAKKLYQLMTTGAILSEALATALEEPTMSLEGVAITPVESKTPVGASQ
jgi:colanic acid/amylovoran biosynthesis glycosyltransferase